MCGIAGILHHGRIADARSRVEAMAASIVHRGPDDEGYWSDADITLGFRRLAIVDLATGHQPMCNEDGTVWVIFNGEIYNHADLRKELEQAGHRFASAHSDTEVLVHGYEQWGEGLAARLNGMFAFAIWDTRQRRLVLARDRLGIKPLYTARASDGALVFASEIRAILASRLIAAAPDTQAVLAYFLQQNVWGKQTLYQGVEQLAPGTMLIVEGDRQRCITYWDIAFNRQRMSARDASDRLQSLLTSTIRRQMAADVPVTAYLSGGIDSSAIVAAALLIDPDVRAYSCLFNLDGVGDDRAVDEREFSSAVAAHLGISHFNLELPPTALKGALHATVAALEEPRMGMAYVNYLIAGRVAQDAKVVLSGTGGDEIFGGYVGRYAHVLKPYDRIGGRFGRILGRALPTVAGRADPMQRMLEMYSFPVTPAELGSAFTPAAMTAGGGYRPADGLAQVLAACPSDEPWDRLMYADAKTYLPGLLMVEDKLSMAHSLEARVPLIDSELIDFALDLDWALLTDRETGKMVFRDAVRDWLPASVANKPKMGFGPPDASWYRGPLQSWIRRLVAPERIAARGVFRPEFVTGMIDRHMSGAVNALPLIWSLLSFDAWCEINGFYGGDLGEPMRPS